MTSISPPKNKIQLPYILGSISLSSYAEKTESNKWVFPDFSDSCPICSASECAVLYAFYSRKARDVIGCLLTLCIARYRCSRKGRAPAGAALTFSLLPSRLAPYRRTEIGLMALLLSLWIIGGKSVGQVLNHASRLSDSCREWLIDPPFLYRLKSFFGWSAAKLNQAHPFRLKFHEEPVDLRVFLEKGIRHIPAQEHFPSGFSGLALEYYFHQGGWAHDAHFLFGTASQHRGG